MKRIPARPRRLAALAVAVPLGIGLPTLAVSAAAGTSATSYRVAAPAADTPSASSSDGPGDAGSTSNEVTDGNGDLCDPGFVPTSPSAAPTDPATSPSSGASALPSGDPSGLPTAGSSGDSNGDSNGSQEDTSCEDSQANLVGADVRAAYVRVRGGARSRITVNVTTARGAALGAGKAVLFERSKRIASAPVAAGKVVFAARRLTRGTHHLHVALVSSTGRLVRERATLTIRVR